MEVIDLLQKKISQSKSIIEDTLNFSKNPYIALSLGKDSIVMAHLIYEIKPKIPCLFLTDESTFLLYDYESITPFYQKIWNIEIIKTNSLTLANFDLEEARKIRKNDWYLKRFLDFDCVFMGLRREESKQRNLTLIRKDSNDLGFRIKTYKSGKRKNKIRSCPISEWRTEEISLYIKYYNLPVLKIYKDFGFLARSTARIPRPEVRHTALAQAKISNPEGFRKLTKLIPEIEFYA